MLHPLIPSETQQYFVDGSYQMFLLDCKIRRLSPRTIEFYNCQILPFLRWCSQRQIVSVAAVMPAHIRAYLAEKLECNLSDYTLHAIARSLRAYLNFCVREELLQVSPMKKVSMPKVERRILPSFEAGDIDKLMRVCTESRDRALIMFLLDTGCRAMELVNLNGGDVDVLSGIVNIRKGKGAKDRTVYLGSNSRKALRRYYLERGRPGSNEPIWRNARTATRLTDSGLRQLLERLGKAAGIEHCHPHTFRRTFALWSLRNGMSLYHLQRLMGHEDIVVLRQYLALVEADLQGAHAQYGTVDNMKR